MNRLKLNNNNKGQATTELAVMGTVILVALLFLSQQVFIYKARQGMEMYTFRQALQMSRNERRGIELTTIRDMVTPSFFSGLSRERITASASIDANPWDLWQPEEDTPQDIGTYQLLQIGEAMVQRGYFIQVPPTKIKVETDDDVENDDWSWKTSSIRELDAQELKFSSEPAPNRESSYVYQKISSDSSRKRSNTDILKTEDEAVINIKFESPAKIKHDYVEQDWEQKVTSTDQVSVDAGTVPRDAIFVLDEKLQRVGTISAPN